MRKRIVWPLVGRDDEVAVAADLLNHPTTRRGLVIAGAAGTGKTRLAEEVLAMMESAGWAGLRITGTRAGATIPLGAFAPLLPTEQGEAANTFEGLRWAAEAIIDHAQGRQIALIVDDAHHLDPASATVVLQLATDWQVVVVVTVRSAEPAPDPILALWKDGQAARLELQDLSLEESTTLLRSALGGDVAADAINEFWIASKGNPLFLRELVLAAVDETVLVQQGGLWTLDGDLCVPPSLQDLIGQRLADVSGADLNAMYTLAFAEMLGLELMRSLHPKANPERLERQGLIQLDHDRRRRPLGLSHPLYGEVLRSRAPRTTAVDVARRLTTAVEEFGARRREDALRVAIWRLQAGGEAPPGLLATAAEQAYHAADFELAERLARTASTDSAQVTRATVLLAQLLDERGEHTQTERLLRSIDPTLLTPQARIRVALVRADNLFFGLGRERESKQVLLEAERRAIDTPTGELTANRAWIELHAGDVRGALDTVTSIASSDLQGRVAADIVAAWGKAVLGDTSGAIQVAEKAAISNQPPSYPAVSRHEGFPGLARGQALLHAGNLEEAEKLARAGWAAALGSGPAFLQARWATLLGTILLERGQAKAAVSTFRQAAGLQRRLGQTGLMRVNLSGQILAAAFAGIQPQDEAALEELDQLPRTPEQLFDTDELSARAWYASARGERSTAAHILREAATLACEAGLVPIEVRLQHDLVRLGHAGEVVDRLTELAPQTDSTSAQARVRHAVACADGDPQLIEAAAATFEDLGLLLLAAEAYAAAAADYARSGRRQTHACRRRAAELDRHCQGIKSPAMVVGDQAAPLTPREREVVTMAAQGLPSKVIAKRLFVSLRTVNNTIQRAYVKLGVHSREEAADALNLDGSQSVTSRS